MGNQFTALEFFSIGSEQGISLVRIEKKKKELVITHQEKAKQFSELQLPPNKNESVYLVINDSNVIQKETEGTEKQDGKILNKAFPNLKQDDFYYEICKLEYKTIVAICRKGYIEKLLSDFNQNALPVRGLSLGVCGLSSITDFLKEYQSVNTNVQKLDVSNNEIVIFPLSETKTTSYKINGLEIQNSYLLGFSTILKGILKDHFNSGNIKDLNDSLRESQFQKKFFDRILKLMIYTLLVILLINYFLFTHYFNAVGQSGAKVEADKNLMDKIRVVGQRVKQKEEQFNATYNESNSRSSAVINQVVSQLPASIILDQLTYHPLQKEIKDNESILFQGNTIVISGKTISSIAFSNWVESLQKQKGISNVTITEYGEDQSQTVFTIKINTDETQ